MTRPKVVAKTELGTKRICASCGTRFYDLNRTPILCPKCEAVFQPPVERAAPAPEAVKAEPAASEEAPVKEEPVLVSLEEAEKEQAPAKRSVKPAEGDEFEIEAAPLDDEDDDPFLAEEEEEDDDVTGLIGGGIEPGDDET